MPVRIDGSFGEGGGQILRTALSLSLVTGQAFRIDNIRAGRKRPGLLSQHLTAVRAAAQVGEARVEGAEPESLSLAFTPGRVRPGEYRFAVGTAGSGTLVLQTVLPALMLAAGPSKLTIEGGTHNLAAPPYHFLEQTFLPLVGRMGPRIRMELDRYGFYPAGGGRFQAVIHPAGELAPLALGERGEIHSRRIRAIVANLPRHIGQREVETAAGLLGWGPESHCIEMTGNSPGPGNVVMIEIGSNEVTEIFTGFGRIGVRAEEVAREAAGEASEYLRSRAAAGEHLADQLLIPLALAGSGSFTAVKLNPHARTNMDVIGKFLPVRFVVAEGEGLVRVTV